MVGKREREQGKERRCSHGLKVREHGKGKMLWLWSCSKSERIGKGKTS